MKKDHTWFIYPVYGLKISDTIESLDNPIWGDAQIFPKETIEKYFSRIINSPSKIGMTTYVQSTFKSEDVCSFMCVRRNIGLPPTDFNKEMYTAQKRLNQVFSLIQLATLIEPSTKWHTCQLIKAERQYSLLTPLTLLNSANPGILGSYRGYSQILMEPIEIDLKSLSENLLKEPLKYISQLITPPKSSKNKKVLGKIGHSIYHLSKAVEATNLSDRILSSLTSLEVILSNHDTTYDQFETRIKNIIGNELFRAYQTEAIIKSRHSYVHRGEEINSVELSMKAVALALITICQYSRNIINFPNSDTFLNYVDFLDKGRKLNEELEGFEYDKIASKIEIENGLQLFDYFKHDENFDEINLELNFFRR